MVILSKPDGVKLLASENMALQQQLMITRRKLQRAPNLTTFDRIFFAVITPFIKANRLVKTAILIRPSTLLKFHRSLVKRKYRNLYFPKSRKKPGPKGPEKELINLILEMKKLNPRFGARRITMQIANQFDVKIDKDIVLRVLAKYQKKLSPKPGGPSWLSFIGNTVDSLWSLDIFKIESMFLKTFSVLVVMDQCSREIIGFSMIRGHPSGKDICRMFIPKGTGQNSRFKATT